MREIKFRIWNKPTNRMSYFELFSPLWRSLSADTRNTLPEYNQIMQYTGLKDKNGKEIYEGDILSRTHKEIKPLDKALLNDMVGALIHPSYIHGRGEWEEKIKVEIPWIYLVDSEGGIDGFEIIGNIYENPDLLK